MVRPAAKAPPGRVTLRQAAQLSGVAYSVIYERVRSGDIPAQRDGSGVYTIARADVRAIKPRARGRGDGRVAVMVRVPAEEHAAWKRAAGDKAVSAWLRKIANLAALDTLTIDHDELVARLDASGAGRGADTRATRTGRG